MALVTMLSVLALISGCATSGDYCDVARAIRPSVDDQMTPETQRQILGENEKLARLCQISP